MASKFQKTKISIFRYIDISKNRKLIFILILIFSTIFTISSLALNGWFGGGDKIPEDTFTRGLVAYYSFDEGTGNIAYDISGNGNNGTIYGAKWTKGKYGSALQFDGVDDYVDLGNDESFNITDELTIEAWVNRGTITGTTMRYIVGKGTNYINEPYILEYDPANGYLRFGIYDGTNYYEVVTGLVKGQWVHLVGVFDGTSVKLYVNGIKKAELSFSQTTIDIQEHSVTIGGCDGGGRYFVGLIDEVRIYNRALSPEEIRYHYNRGRPVAHWRFDEGSGNIAYDSTSNNNDCTWSGSGSHWTNQGKFNGGAIFNGIDDYLSCQNVGNIKTISFWVKPKSLTQSLIDLNGTQTITLSNGQIQAQNFTSPTIYVDGKQSSTLPDTNWHHIAITTKSTISASNVYLGKVGSNYFNGILDDIRLYNYVRSPDEIRLDYNAGLAVKLGGSPSQINWTYETQWLYKRKITISGSTSDLTDYQVLLTLDTQSLISQGKMRSDCGDIRFGNSTGKVLNYWIEPNTCNTTSTKIWVKIPSIPTSGTTIYLYYGNSSVRSESNAQNTFIRIIDGVVGSWHFDEGSGTTAYDTSGNDNDGTLKNGPQWIDGKYGKALSFDGSDDYVNCGNSSNLNFGTNDFTIESWIKTNYIEKWQLIVSKSYNPGYELFVARDNGKLLFQIGDGSGWTNFLGNTVVADGNWHHVVAVADRDNNGILYVDGNFDNEKSITSKSGSVDSEYNLHVGTRPPSTGYAFNGIIDEVRIYNRALTPDEISDLYNNYGYTTENYPGKVLVRKYAEPESTATIGEEQATLMPIAHWKFDKGQGNIAYDSTPNHNNGTIYGAIWTKGKFGKALKFDGIDDYLSTQSPLNSQSQFSYSLWFQSSDGKYSTNEYLFNQGTDDPSVYIDNNGNLNIKINSNLKCQISNPNLKSQKWNHLEIIGDGSTLKVYLNGSLVCTANYTGSTAQDILYLGSASQTTGFFGGKIDDFRIYPYARSPDQVKIDYNAGFGIKLGGSPTNIFSGSKLYPEWKYRKPITITGSSENLTDYQVLITLDTASLISDGKMKSDCSDIRFTDADDNQTLPYWIESGCNTSQTKIWVKVPSIPTNGTTIYMYYGNPSASSESDGDAVFEFFDDFEDYTEKWNPGGDQPVISSEIVDGRTVVKITDDGSYCAGIETKEIINVENRVIERMLKGWTSGSTDVDENLGIDTSWKAYWWSSDNLMHGVFDLPGGADSHGVEIGGNGGANKGSKQLSTTEWKIAKTIIKTGEIIGIYDGEEISKEGTPIYTGKIMLATDNDAASAGVYYDWIRVRKYADPEPTATVGDEQSNLMPQILLHFGEGSGSTAYDDTPNNNDCSLSGTSFKKGILGTGLYFSGSADANCGNIGNIKTLSFFINPLSLNQPILDLDGGTNYIELVGGKIHLVGNSWQSPKLYVNGKQIPLDENNYSINTLLQAQWYHIEIVNSTSISATNFTLGKVGTSYFVGTLDELRAYNYQRTPDQIKIDFNAGVGIRFK